MALTFISRPVSADDVKVLAVRYLVKFRGHRSSPLRWAAQLEAHQGLALSENALDATLLVTNFTQTALSSKAHGYIVVGQERRPDNITYRSGAMKHILKPHRSMKSGRDSGANLYGTNPLDLHQLFITDQVVAGIDFRSKRSV